MLLLLLFGCRVGVRVEERVEEYGKEGIIFKVGGEPDN